MSLARTSALTVLASAAVAGCGSSGSATTASAPSATSTATASAAAGAPSSAKRVAVAIKDFDYAPKRVFVSKGSTVTWTNDDPANHTVTFDTGAKKDLGNQRTGSKRSMRFTKAGTYAYHCDFHPNMHGTVVVR